jgi:hypothetical protein
MSIRRRECRCSIQSAIIRRTSVGYTFKRILYAEFIYVRRMQIYIRSVREHDVIFANRICIFYVWVCEGRRDAWEIMQAHFLIAPLSILPALIGRWINAKWLMDQTMLIINLNSQDASFYNRLCFRATHIKEHYCKRNWMKLCEQDFLSNNKKWWKPPKCGERVKIY